MSEFDSGGEPVRQRHSADLPGGYCSSCGGHNHQSKDCPNKKQMSKELLSCDFCGCEKKKLITWPDSAGEWKNGIPVDWANLCFLCSLLPSAFRRDAKDESLVMIVGFNYLAGLIEKLLEEKNEEL